MKKISFLILCSFLFSINSYSQFGKGQHPGGAQANANAANSSAPVGGGSGPQTEVQPGYHYVIHYHYFNLTPPFIHKQFQPIAYTYTRTYKVLCKSCRVPPNIPTEFIRYDSHAKKFDTTLNAGNSIKNLHIKRADTCLSYIRSITYENGNTTSDTLVAVSQVDTIYKYLPKNLRHIGISQDSGKLQILLTGINNSVLGPEVAPKIKSYSKAEKKWMGKPRYNRHLFYISEVDSGNNCCTYFKKLSATSFKLGAYVYQESKLPIPPSRITRGDSINNFYLFVKPRKKVRDTIYYYSVPFSRTEGGVITIPLQGYPFLHNSPLNNVSTSFFNANVFFGQEWGNTRFFYDPSKTHTTFTGMVAVFAGLGQLPALTMTNCATDPSLVGTSQLGFSYGVAATASLDIFNFGVFVGTTEQMFGGELYNAWYYENKIWIGIGVGFNIIMFNNAITNQWE